VIILCGGGFLRTTPTAASVRYPIPARLQNSEKPCEGREGQSAFCCYAGIAAMADSVEIVHVSEKMTQFWT